MRIEAYTQIQQMYQQKAVNKAHKANGAGPTTDKVQISTFGKDIHIAKAALEGTPDVREDLTVAVKARIDNGTYTVDNADFAGKLFAKYEEMR